MFVLLFVFCLTAAVSFAPSDQKPVEKQVPVHGCLMQDASWKDGLSRTFRLDIVDSDEVFFVLTLDLSDWDNVTVEIRNLQHNSVDFKLRPYREGKNRLETWLVKGSYEISFKAYNDFACISLCYRYSPATRPICKENDAYAATKYATYIQCKIVVPPNCHYELVKFINFKYATAFVSIDKSDISTSKYDFTSLVAPLYVPLQPSENERTIYFLLAVEAYPTLVIPFGYKTIGQEYSECFWKDMSGAINTTLNYIFTIPQPGALTTLMLTPRNGEDIDLYLDKIDGPVEFPLYIDGDFRYRSENDAGEQDLIQVWLPGGKHTAFNVGYSAFTGGSFCISYSKPKDVPHCKEKDVIFGELYYPYKKCKIEVDSCEHDQLLIIDFDNDAIVYASKGDASVSRGFFEYSASSSPLYIPVSASNKKRTYYVQLQMMRFIRQVNFAYHIKKLTAVKSCFFEGLCGAAGPGSKSYELRIPFDMSRVVITANPGPDSKFTLEITSTSPSKSPSTVQPYSTNSSVTGQPAVIDTWLPKGTYRVSYESDSAFSSASLCYRIIDRHIPDCKAKNVIASIHPAEYFQCKITFGKESASRLLEVVVAPRRLVGSPPTPQREIFISVDKPLSPQGPYDYSNKDTQSASQGLFPFVKVSVRKGEAHTYYVLFLADMQGSIFGNSFFSYSIRPKHLVEALQKYKSVKPQPSPDGCGHNQYWNDGEQFATSLGVVGGKDALSHEFPWQAAIVANTSSQYCGGAVLNNRWVITAGRCCFGYERQLIDVRVGSDYGFLEKSADCTVLQPEEVIVHPYFGKARETSISFDFDFCLLKMPEDLDLSSWHVRPICLPESCDETCNPGDRVLLSGFGYTAQGRNFSKKLQKVILPIVEPKLATQMMTNNDPSDQPFSRSFTRVPAFPIGRVDGGVDGCTGDYGSPVACFKKGAFYLDGVFSFGDTCGTPQYPSGAAKVCEVLSWIHNYIDADQ